MKKTLRTLAVLIGVSAALASCGSLPGSAPKMDTPETTAKIAETLRDKIDTGQWKVYSVRWMEGEELENELSSLNVEMVNRSGGGFHQTFVLGGPGAGTVSDLREAIGMGKPSFETTRGITADMIDPAAIQQQYEQAKAMIPEGYTFKSIGSYSIEETIPTGNPFLDKGKEAGALKTSFSLNVTEDGKEIIESAGKKSVQYYQIDFDVKPDGSIEMKE